MSAGAKGAWDGVDDLNPSVIQFQGKLIDYYSGYDGSIWRTGYATSNDEGLTWDRLPWPVVDLGGWDTQYIAANGSAIVINGKVNYYFHGKAADGKQQIGVATSNDGKNFKLLPNPVVPAGVRGAWDDFAVADPFVMQVGSNFWMYYLTVSHDYKFHMGRAVSSDGLNWVKDKDPLTFRGAEEAFDAGGAGEPSVVYISPYFYMFYMGSTTDHRHSLGWATSTDGLTWDKHGLLIPDTQRPSWASAIMGDPTLMETGRNDGTYYLWFGAGTVANPSQNVYGQIGRMTIKIEQQ